MILFHYYNSGSQIDCKTENCVFRSVQLKLQSVSDCGPTITVSTEESQKEHISTMRQLKGKVKESRKERRERRQENVNNKQNIVKVVLPIMALIVSLIVGFVYLNSRPKIKAPWLSDWPELDHVSCCSSTFI